MNACVHLKFIGCSPDILTTLLVNNNQVFNQNLDDNHHVVDCVFDNTEYFCKQNIKIFMSGKTKNHTVVDQQGNIVSDCAVIVEKIFLDDIDVTEIYCAGTECYVHNNNGATENIVDQFYSYIGCNGTVDISWSTPMNLWFLKQCQ